MRELALDTRTDTAEHRNTFLRTGFDLAAVRWSLRHCSAQRGHFARTQSVSYRGWAEETHSTKLILLNPNDNEAIRTVGWIYAV
jgi:hypothetical protein